MSNNTVANSIRFIVLALLQVVLLNHIDFLGYIDPYLYILFIFWFPFSDNKIPLIFFSFLLGLTIDVFNDSGAVHAAASVFIAYARPLFLRIAFGNSFEQYGQKLGQSPLTQRIVYLILMILTHHLVLFSLEIFSFANPLYVLQKTIYTGAFTLILTILSVSLFSKK